MNDIVSRLQAAVRHPQLLTPELVLDALTRIGELERANAELAGMLRLVEGGRDAPFVTHVVA